MKHISIGGLDVSRIGLGTMAMSGYYLDPSSSDAESIRTIQRALDLGVTHIDTAEIYGPFANEELVGRTLEGRRDDVVLATKFGFVSHAGQDSDLLAAQSRNAAAAVGDQPRLLRGDPAAAGGEEVADLLLGLHSPSVDPVLPAWETLPVPLSTGTPTFARSAVC